MKSEEIIRGLQYAKKSVNGKKDKIGAQLFKRKFGCSRHKEFSSELLIVLIFKVSSFWIPRQSIFLRAVGDISLPSIDTCWQKHQTSRKIHWPASSHIKSASQSHDGTDTGGHGHVIMM